MLVLVLTNNRRLKTKDTCDWAIQIDKLSFEIKPCSKHGEKYLCGEHWSNGGYKCYWNEDKRECNTNFNDQCTWNGCKDRTLGKCSSQIKTDCQNIKEEDNIPCFWHPFNRECIRMKFFNCPN